MLGTQSAPHLLSWLLCFLVIRASLFIAWRTGWPLSFLAALRFYDLLHFMQMSIKHSALHAEEKKEGGWVGMVPNSKWLTHAGKKVTGQLSAPSPPTPGAVTCSYISSCRIWEGWHTSGWHRGAWALGNHPLGGHHSVAGLYWNFYSILAHKTKREKQSLHLTKLHKNNLKTSTHKCGAGNYLDLVNHATKWNKCSSINLILKALFGDSCLLSC